ncbi:MAG: epoxyqueuosine reductase, partial [Flavobacteriales bacterium]
FIAELLLDIDLAPDPPATEHCGTCRRCLDACPTGAIVRPAVVDASRCISTFTIELRGPIPEPIASQLTGWAFGCDICQEVCPWNRHAQPHTEPAFDPHPALFALDAAAWRDLTEEAYRELFRHSAVKRTGYAGLRRNLRAIFGLPPLPSSGQREPGEGLVDDIAVP